MSSDTPNENVTKVVIPVLTPGDISGRDPYIPGEATIDRDRNSIHIDIQLVDTPKGRMLREWLEEYPDLYALTFIAQPGRRRTPDGTAVYPDTAQTLDRVSGTAGILGRRDPLPERAGEATDTDAVTNKLDFTQPRGRFVITPKMLTEIELSDWNAFIHVARQKAREYGITRLFTSEDVNTGNHIIEWEVLPDF